MAVLRKEAQAHGQSCTSVNSSCRKPHPSLLKQERKGTGYVLFLIQNYLYRRFEKSWQRICMFVLVWLFFFLRKEKVRKGYGTSISNMGANEHVISN